ncbi:putative F-box domain-containing protein [Helianthus annuus]|nr:putative F-box domain-containing protein [Helianthus annuus]
MEDSDQQSTHSGAVIGSNDDLLTEILLRLPVTSILRFKSVSTHWRFAFESHTFHPQVDKISKSPGIFAGNVYVPFDVQNRGTPPFPQSRFFSPILVVSELCNLVMDYSFAVANKGA